MSVFLPLSPALVMAFRRFPAAVVSRRCRRSGSLRLSSHPRGMTGVVASLGRCPWRSRRRGQPGRSRDARGMMQSCDSCCRPFRGGLETMRMRPASRAGWAEPLFSALWRFDAEEVLSLCSRSRCRRRCAAPARLLVDLGLLRRPLRPCPAPLRRYPVIAPRDCLARRVSCFPVTADRGACPSVRFFPYVAPASPIIPVRDPTRSIC